MKKKVYESPVTTCRQVLMEADVMVVASVVETNGKISAGHSVNDENVFDKNQFDSDSFTGW